MSDRRIEKVVLLEYVKELFENSPYAIFITYNGLSVQAAGELRDKVNAVGARCQVLKNSYLMLGLKEAGLEVPEDFELTGDTAVIFGSENDPVAPAKVVKEFSKDHDVVTFKAGIVDGRFVDAADLAALADLPSREALLSILLGVMKAPGAKLVRVLSTRRSSLVWLLENHAKKLEESA